MQRNERSDLQRRLRFALCLLVVTAPGFVQAHTDVATRWAPQRISSNQYESTPTFTPDGREMFFMSSNPRFERYRILWSRCTRDGWTRPTPPSFAGDPSVLEADPFVTADGKRVYFISSRHKRDQEDLDIWYVDRERDGSWGVAHPLPSPVNSTSAELLPRATADGRVYFGSSRPGGLGQGDIYVAARVGNEWRVSNVGPPVNTASFEYEAEISSDERTMIVVADRGDRSHLYRFRKRDGRWIEQGRVPARPDVFQVGPLLSPEADRLLFAQVDADSARSGEMFLIDLSKKPDPRWPPSCHGDPRMPGMSDDSTP